MRNGRTKKFNGVLQKRRNASRAASVGVKDAEVSTNWDELKKKMKEHKAQGSKTRKISISPGETQKQNLQDGEDIRERRQIKSDFGLDNVAALDCEMVSVSREGSKQRAAARIAIVDGLGDVVMDDYAHPEATVLDYHSKYSGILPKHLKKAAPLSAVRQKVQKLLKGKIVVGHALKNDLESLGIEHPIEDTRDTATYGPMTARLIEENVRHSGSLRVLAKHHLCMDIQNGAHNPVDDARASLYLYRRFKKEWEAKRQKRSIGKKQRWSKRWCPIVQ